VQKRPGCAKPGRVSQHEWQEQKDGANEAKKSGLNGIQTDAQKLHGNIVKLASS
jgi:hypothetical protein